MIERLLRFLTKRRRPLDAERIAMKAARRYANAPEAIAAGIDRYVIAAQTMTIDELLKVGSRVASRYVIEGKRINVARSLAIQDLAGSIREINGYEMAKEWRGLMEAMPVLLLLSPEAHRAAARNVAALEATAKRLRATVR
ncbi:MAG: hypothetical protein KIS96_11520 [Bauldia sp.]|nr:hypothetical protein [Bauldia sp.]